MLLALNCKYLKTKEWTVDAGCVFPAVSLNVFLIEMVRCLKMSGFLMSEEEEGKEKGMEMFWLMETLKVTTSCKIDSGNLMYDSGNSNWGSVTT